MLCYVYFVDVYGLGFTENKPLNNKPKKWRTTVPSAARTFFETGVGGVGGEGGFKAKNINGEVG